MVLMKTFDQVKSSIFFVVPGHQWIGKVMEKETNISENHISVYVFLTIILPFPLVGYIRAQLGISYSPKGDFSRLLRAIRADNQLSRAHSIFAGAYCS